jgi:hypothetical protein
MSSGIPLFFPTKRFLKDLWTSGKARFGCNYWREFAKREPPGYLSTTDNHDFWLDRADYYDIPGYYYFDSFDELVRILALFFRDTKYEERKKWLEDRKKRVYNAWRELIK